MRGTLKGSEYLAPNPLVREYQGFRVRGTLEYHVPNPSEYHVGNPSEYHVLKPFGAEYSGGFGAGTLEVPNPEGFGAWYSEGFGAWYSEGFGALVL